jgi:hypothetical protein
VENIHWDVDTKRLSFMVSTHNLRYGKIALLLPLKHSGFVLSGIEVNEQTVEYNNQTLGSMNYAAFSLTAKVNDIVAYYAI